MARMQPKPLQQEAIVSNGATSGIGLATARMASRQGARVVLTARNEPALKQLCGELRDGGGHADCAVADVAGKARVDALSVHAVSVSGGVDTWINDAGAFICGRLDAVALDDQRRLSGVTCWGRVHGTPAAAERLKSGGGAIVNVDTAFMEHARNRLGSPGTHNPPPAYRPDLMARAILHAGAHPVRDLVVGGLGGGALMVSNRLAPRMMDWTAVRASRSPRTSINFGVAARRDALCEPREDLAERRSLHSLTRKTSLTLETRLQPTAKLASVGAILLAARPRRNAANHGGIQ